MSSAKNSVDNIQVETIKKDNQTDNSIDSSHTQRLKSFVYVEGGEGNELTNNKL